jgi:AraC-like DNA-binding protein
VNRQPVGGPVTRLEFDGRPPKVEIQSMARSVSAGHDTSAPPGRGRKPASRGDECFRLACAVVFQVVQAERLAGEQAGVTGVRVSGDACLLFTVHGGCVVHTDTENLDLHASEALLRSNAREEITFFRSPATEVYFLRFRAPRSPAQAPRHRLEVPDHVTVLRPGRLTHLLRRLVDETRRPLPSRAVQHHLVVLALCELARSSRVQDADDEGEAGRESIASRVDAYIAAHYHEPVGTIDIARELRYNPDYLERAFRMERHMSIREAVHARRIKEASAQLLLQSTQDVAQIAALCGYTDPGYFRRVFKRATNMTPRGYRLVHAARPQEMAAVAAGFNA